MRKKVSKLFCIFERGILREEFFRAAANVGKDLRAEAGAMIEAHSISVMAKSFGTFRKRKEVKDQQDEHIQEFWKFAKIDIETLVKKMDVGHPDRWNCLDEVVKYLIDLQQLREYYKQMLDETLNSKEGQN